MVRPQMHNGCRINQVFGNGTVMYSAWSNQPELPSDECTVEIRLEGLRTKVVTLRDGAVVSLKRLGESEGVVNPASSLNAPKPAAKAYSKGVEALRHGKWDEAQKQLEQAIKSIPSTHKRTATWERRSRNSRSRLRRRRLFKKPWN